MNAADSQIKIISEIYRTYQNMLSIQNLYDYEDLIFHVVRQFESDENFCKKYQKQFQHVFVDEYQDLNQAQYRIIRAAGTRKKHRQRPVCHWRSGSGHLWFQRF
jgi:DNA helicase-2/ATP-dependent DNA helicase PcrA